MRLGILISITVALCLLGTACGGSTSSPAPSAENKQKETAPVASTPAEKVAPTPPGAPPATILFETSYGNVTFTHQKHFERVNNDCSTCHPKIFPQAREPLNYAKARHRDAEEYMRSCATCHNVTSIAFAAERKCEKCHDKAPVAP